MEYVGAVLLRGADADAGDGEEFGDGGGLAGGDGLEGLIAEDAEGGDAAAFGFGRTPLLQDRFERGGWLFGLFGFAGGAIFLLRFCLGAAALAGTRLDFDIGLDEQIV